MAAKSIKDGTVADAYLALLADRGVDYFFGNAGTDFAPIIESFATAAANGTPAPKPIPVPSHYVANAEKLPIVTIIFNNEHWGAVRRNTRAMYPDGYAARSNREPLTYFEPGVEYEHAVEVAGGHGERVEDAAELPAAMERAVESAVNDGRQALINVVCGAS